jgi:predicted flavoprotein YhiN
LKRLGLTVGKESQVLGEAVVTRAGLEGGAIYAVGASLRTAIARQNGAPATLSLDLKPGMTIAELARALTKPRGKQTLSNHLRKTVGLPPVMIALLHEGIGRTLPADAEALAAAIKCVPIAVTGFSGLERAISSAGGIALDEIDSHFMLKKKPGIFVAGEMLDWDAPTGGYLLQASFATGRAAAIGIAQWLTPQTETAQAQIAE